MSDTDLSSLVAQNETLVQHLSLKSESDDATIRLLKQQVQKISSELRSAIDAHASEMRRVTEDHATAMLLLRQERDVAETKAVQVGGIISSICELGLSGLRKMQERPITEDSSFVEMAEQIPDRQPQFTTLSLNSPAARPVRYRGQDDGVHDHPLLPRIAR